MTGGSRVGLIAQAVALVLLLLLPTLASLSGYQLHIVELILLTIPLGIGLLITMGLCGQINLAQVALYGVGAYTTAILIIAGTCRPMGGDVRGCAGRRCHRDGRRPAVSSDPGSLPCDRDIGIGRCGRNDLHCRRRSDRRAAGNRPHPDAAGIDTSEGRDAGYYPLLVGFFAVAWAFARMLVAGPIGSAFGAIRDDHLAAKGVGVNVGAFQLLAFTLAGLFAGMAGALYATWSGYISPDSFRPAQMFFLLTILVVGGMRSLPGLVIATTVLIVAREAFQQFEAYQLIIFGSLVTLVMLVAPDGLAGLAGRAVRWARKAASTGTPRPTAPALGTALPHDQERD